METQPHADPKATIRTCRFAAMIMAVACNYTPLLFLVLQDTYGFSYARLGALVTTNFLTQVATDIAFSRAAEKYGFRSFVVLGQALCTVGFIAFACTPWLCVGWEYGGFVLSTILFSVGAGLQELLLSPIVDSAPTPDPEKAMSGLHSFYAWGQILCVAGTTLLLSVFGSRIWPYVLLGWAILPLICTILFTRVPIWQRVSAQRATPMGKMLRRPVFLVAFLAILFGGASELAMCQWTSAFLERAVCLPKVWGDILGLCGFALMMGLGRTLHAKIGERVDLHLSLILGAGAAVLLYLTAALTGLSWLAVAACCLTGLCVSMLWPGTLNLAVRFLPLAGAAMFALLSAGGDIGGAVGPWISGIVADTVQNAGGIAGLTPDQAGLKAGILTGALFPLGAFLCQLALYLMRKKAAVQAAKEVKEDRDAHPEGDTV